MNTIRVSLALAALVLLGCGATATVASAPSIEGESVSHVTATDATLEAQIKPNGTTTTYRFRLDYGCGVSRPRSGGVVNCMSIATIHTPAQEVPASSEAQQVSLDLNSANVTLHPDTRYRYNIEATNSAGSAQGEGEGQIFTTPPAWDAPRIEAESVSNITPTDATLEAKINTEGLETTYVFRLAERWACEEAEPACLRPGLVTIWGLPSGKLLGSFATQTVSLDLNSAGVTLMPGHDFYEYSVSATNSAGLGEGQSEHFTTPSDAGAKPLSEPSGGTDPQSSTTIQSPSSSSAPHHRRHHRRHKRGLHRSSLHRAGRAG
jgi:hypothetical protein